MMVVNEREPPKRLPPLLMPLTKTGYLITFIESGTVVLS